MLALLLVTAALSGCIFGTGEAPETVQEWREESQANRPFGQPADPVELHGSPLVVTGELTTEVAPDTLHPGETLGTDGAFLFVDGTQLADGRSGMVVLEGAQLEVQAGSLQNVEVTEVNASEGLRISSPTEPGISDPSEEAVPGWEEADEAVSRVDEWSASPDELRIANASQARLVNQGRAAELSTPLELDGGTMFADDEVTLTASAVTGSAERFRVAGNITGGQAAIDGGPSRQAPSVVTGNADRVSLTPGSFQAEEGVRLTQIVDGDPLVDAALELHPPSQRLVVPEGAEDETRVWYHEHGYEGDALVQDVQVGGPDNLTTVPLEQPGFLDALRDLPVEAWLVLGPGVPFLMFGAALADMLSSDPATLPTWVDAGSVGFFDLVVDGSAVEVGTYEVTVTLDGNFEPVSTDLEVEIAPDEGSREDPRPDEAPPGPGS